MPHDMRCIAMLLGHCSVDLHVPSIFPVGYMCKAFGEAHWYVYL